MLRRFAASDPLMALFDFVALEGYASGRGHMLQTNFPQRTVGAAPASVARRGVPARTNPPLGLSGHGVRTHDARYAAERPRPRNNLQGSRSLPDRDCVCAWCMMCALGPYLYRT